MQCQTIPNPKNEWPKNVVQAFENLKVAIAEAVTLAHPKQGAKVAITADALLTGIGAVLEGWHKGTWRPISSFSKKLSSAQSKYSTFGRQLLALYEAVKYFRHFLQGADFVPYTDQKPLVGKVYRKSDPLTVVQQPHLSFLAEYTSDI